MNKKPTLSDYFANNINKISNVLFIDIETVPEVESFEELSERKQMLWVKKVSKQIDEKPIYELYFEKSAVYTEFSKIVCISVGYLKLESNNSAEIRIKNFYGDDEGQILKEFAEILNAKFNNQNEHFLCAHNGLEFDFPFLCRKLLIHNIQLPNLLQLQNTKSWNTPWILDTLEMWKFGEFRSMSSLETLATCFNIPTSKDDISGADVAGVYYFENDLERIAKYCAKDVSVLAAVFLRLIGINLQLNEVVV